MKIIPVSVKEEKFMLLIDDLHNLFACDGPELNIFSNCEYFHLFISVYHHLTRPFGNQYNNRLLYNSFYYNG